MLGCCGVKRGWQDAGLGFECCELHVELGDVQQGSGKLFVDSSEFECQLAVGVAECGNSLLIMGGGGCKVGNGIYCILLVDGIGGLVSGTCRHDFSSAELMVTEGEVMLEMLPSLVRFWMAFPDFAIVKKKACRINELIGSGND